MEDLRCSEYSSSGYILYISSSGQMVVPSAQKVMVLRSEDLMPIAPELYYGLPPGLLLAYR